MVHRAANEASDSPSAWRHRVPAIVLALVGAGIAAYLALYQIGAIAHVWEPLFDGGSRSVLDSRAARVLPVPDALLGACGYLSEAIAAAVGNNERWQTLPLATLVYGLIVALFAAGSVLLLLGQIVILHTACTLCLGSAVISFIVLGLSYREPLAALAQVRRQRTRGCTLWQALRGNAAGGRDAKAAISNGDERTAARRS